MRAARLNPWVALAALASALLLALFAGAVSYYATTTERMERDPLVTNLRPGGFHGRVAFAASGGWETAAFDDSGWADAALPFPTGEDVRRQPGAGAAAGGSVYYRLHVPVSPALFQSGREIGFSPMYVSHRAFQVYVDGRLAFIGGTEQQLFPNVTVTIPREAVHGGQALVAIAGTMDPEHMGIAHHGGVYVGPRDTLDQLYVHVERAMGTYFLLPLLTKGSIFVVFALFFAFNPRQRGLAAFVLYAFFSTVENLFYGDFYSARLGISLDILGMFVTKTVAALALGAFLLAWQGAGRVLRVYRPAGVALTLALGGLAWAYGAYGAQPGGFSLFAVTDWVLAGAVLLPFLLSLKRRSSDPEQRSMTVATGLYLALCAWEFVFHPFVGFEKRPVYDLVFFYYLAIATARSFGRKDQEVAMARVATAIAQTTQMLAHDVRKPFRMLEMMLAALAAKNHPELAPLLQSLGADLTRSVAAVDGMLTDIMEVGNERPPRRSPVALGTLLEAALLPVLKPRPGLAIGLAWELGQRHQLDVDPAKVTRVLANILENAVEATGPRGRIWVRAEEQGRLLTLAIGNSGSYVPPEEREALFETFYTKGKKSGTGLGLAIAQKVVRQHGGTIRCASDRERGTEMVLTLPLADVPDEVRPALPRSSDDVAAPRTAAPARLVTPGLPEVIVVDDSVFIQEAWLLGAAEARVHVHVFDGPAAFWQAVKADPDLLKRARCLITDFYFGKADRGEDGLTFAAAVRRVSPLKVFVASDAPLLPESLGGVVDAVIEKGPLPWAQLAALVSA